MYDVYIPNQKLSVRISVTSRYNKNLKKMKHIKDVENNYFA